MSEENDLKYVAVVTEPDIHGSGNYWFGYMKGWAEHYPNYIALINGQMLVDAAGYEVSRGEFCHFIKDKEMNDKDKYTLFLTRVTRQVIVGKVKEVIFIEDEMKEYILGLDDFDPFKEEFVIDLILASVMKKRIIHDR